MHASGLHAGADDEPVLLLPPEYQLLEPARNLPRLAQLLHIAKLQGSKVQALTFGIRGAEKVSPCACLTRAGHPVKCATGWLHVYVSEGYPGTKMQVVSSGPCRLFLRGAAAI